MCTNTVSQGKVVCYCATCFLCPVCSWSMRRLSFFNPDSFFGLMHDRPSRRPFSKCATQTIEGIKSRSAQVDACLNKINALNIMRFTAAGPDCFERRRTRQKYEQACVPCVFQMPVFMCPCWHGVNVNTALADCHMLNMCRFFQSNRKR